MLKNHQTTQKKPSKAWFLNAFLTNRFVTSSNTPSRYVKYSSVRASLVPCVSFKSVGFYCGKVVERLFIAGGQVGNLYTESTIMVFDSLGPVSVSTGLHTGFAQIISAFTQAKMPNFNLLASYLCPLYTWSINTTNLIKE